MALRPGGGEMASSSVSFQRSSSMMEIDKLRSIYGEKFTALGSPVKEKTAHLNRPIRIVGSFLPSQPSASPAAAIYAFGNNGSKEDLFFDSHPWLDSDGDDDFFSVKGDFTPSRGNTPLHHSFKAVTTKPYIGKNHLEDKSSVSVSENLPKKRLAELLQETRAEEEAERRKLTESVWPEKLEMKPGTLNISRSASLGSHRYTDGIIVPERQKSGRCLPSLELCRSFSGRKKKVMIPTVDSYTVA